MTVWAVPTSPAAPAWSASRIVLRRSAATSIYKALEEGEPRCVSCFRFLRPNADGWALISTLVGAESDLNGAVATLSVGEPQGHRGPRRLGLHRRDQGIAAFDDLVTDFGH
jgi:hypothetical protein